MALIDTVQTTSVTVPTYIRQLGSDANGKLLPDILRSWGRSGLMFEPVSYAMEALFLAAADAGFVLDNVGNYRTYVNQVNLFLSRYQKEFLFARPTKVWNGVVYYQMPGTAMAATPGSSNHGLGLALDVCLYRAVAMSDALLIWMRDNAPKFAFGLESRSERWHWHWRGNNAIPQLVVDVLASHGVTIPSQARYGFTVPSPTAPPAPQEDLMPINVNKPAYDSRTDPRGPFGQGTGRNIAIPDAKGHKWAELGLVAVEANGGGFFAISNTGVKPGTAALNVEPGGLISGQRSGMFFVNGDGAVDVYFDSGGVEGVSCHLVVDVAVVGD